MVSQVKLDCCAPRFTILLLLGTYASQEFRMDYMWAQSFKTFYRLHNLATNWHQARQICEAEGSALLVPDSIDEMENLKILLSNMKSFYTAIFVGLHDHYSTGVYVNLKGEPLAGSLLELLWEQDLPDNINNSEHCVVMTRAGLLDDRPCDDIYPFICKILGEDVKPNRECNNFDLGYVAESNGKCYKYHVEPLNWHDAYLICKSELGHMAIINSAEEAALVTKFFGEHLVSNAPDPDILHLGFSDLMFPYQYRTIFGQTLEEAGYASWNPVKENPSEMSLKRCGAISRNGYLQMNVCDRPAMYLCERLAANTTASVHEKQET